MGDIKFYCFEANNLSDVIASPIRLEGDYGDFLNNKDQEIFRQIWQERKNGQWDGRLGNFWDTQGALSFIGINFRHYDVISATISLPQRPLSENLYDLSRASSVGVALYTSDKKLVVQRRGDNILAAGLLDCSAAGMCNLKEGDLEFEEFLRVRMETELGLKRSDLIEVSPTNVHDAYGYGGNMVSYKARTHLSFPELKERIDPLLVNELVPINESELLDFIVESFSTGELIGDGWATFLSSLEEPAYKRTVQALRVRGCKISFGELVDGQFVEY